MELIDRSFQLRSVNVNLVSPSRYFSCVSRISAGEKAAADLDDVAQVPQHRVQDDSRRRQRRSRSRNSSASRRWATQCAATRALLSQKLALAAFVEV